MQNLVLTRTDDGPPPPPPQGPIEKTRRSHREVSGRLRLVLTLGKDLDECQKVGGVLWVRDDPSGPWHQDLIEKEQFAGGSGSDLELFYSPLIEPKEVAIQPKGYDWSCPVEPGPRDPTGDAPFTSTS